MNMERLFIFFCDGLIYLLIAFLCCVGVRLCENPNHSPRTRYPDNSTCLHQAIFLEDAADLIRRGADVNAQTYRGETPLHRRLRYYYEPFPSTDLHIIQLLVLNGADANIQNKEGQTPLHILFDETKLAGKRRPVSQEMLLTLLRAGADIHLKDNQGKSVLDCAPNEKVKDFLLQWENSQRSLILQTMLLVDED